MAERPAVNRLVEGSSPSWGARHRSQVVRHESAKLTFVGSTPTGASTVKEVLTATTLVEWPHRLTVRTRRSQRRYWGSNPHEATCCATHEKPRVDPTESQGGSAAKHVPVASGPGILPFKQETRVRIPPGTHLGVAQPGRALALGARGRRSESCLPDSTRRSSAW